MMDADECFRVGAISRLVPQDQVMPVALAIARDLASKPPVAMRLNRARFREVTQSGLRDALAAGVRNQREAYATGEPARMMEAFLAKRAARKA
jgi:1,4-dihydroxy-2-naphthoyl-CoA synthase